MKTKLLLIALLISTNLFAQRNRGETHALIIGISDYNDANITDLDYAHIDAIAFGDYLKSAAGGSVPDENVTILTNSEATNGAIYNALFNLRRKVKEKDKVFFYFSGHGDVEKDTIYNLGFLLAWDTPYNCYRNNALSLEELNREAARMSLNAKANVVYILDACRAGELAGDTNNGRKLASNQMKKREAREVRIMSCESDQKSLEHSDVDGGRGLFSYYLIKGLTGMAERKGREDGQVTLKELRNYLEDAVADKADTYNHQQDPFVEGDREFHLAFVDEEALKRLENEEAKNNETLIIASVIPTEKGGSNSKRDNIKHAQNLIKAIKKSGLLDHPDFEKNVNGEDKDFYQFILQELQEPDYNSELNQDEKSSIQFFTVEAKDLIKNDTWRKNMNQNIAISLNDLAQQAINAYLQTDLKELGRRRYTNVGEGLKIYPSIMEKALEMLGDKHPLHKSLEIKYHYFKGVVKRLEILKTKSPEELNARLIEAMIDQQKAFALDDKAPYIYNELGILHLLLKDKKKAESHFKKAIDLSPTWAIPYSNLSGIYNSTQMLEKAKLYADTAISLRPDFPGAWSNLGLSYRHEMNLIKAESKYRKSMELDSNSYVPYEQLAYLYLTSNNYDLAEKFFVISDKRKGIYKEQLQAFNPMMDPTILASLAASGEGPLNDDIIKTDCPPFQNQDLENRIKQNPNDVDAYYQYALFQEKQGCGSAAIPYYEKVLELDSRHLQAAQALGNYYYDSKNYDKAVDQYFIVINLDAENFESRKRLADMLHFKLNRTTEAVPVYYQAIRLSPDNLDINKTLAEHFFNQKAYEASEVFYLRLSDLSTLDAKTNFDMAQLYEQWGHDEEAAYYLNTVLQMEHTDSYFQITAADHLFNLYKRQHRYKEAEALLIKTGLGQYPLEGFYEERTIQFPDNVYWLYQLARTQFSSNYQDKKYVNLNIQNFKKLLLLKPDHESLTDIYIKTGDLYNRIDSFDNSTAYYEMAIARDTSNANTYFKVIDSHLSNYQKEEALYYLELMHTNQLISIEKRIKLAELLSLAGRYEEAEQTLKKADEMYPLEWDLIYKNYSTLYWLKNDLNKAITNNKKALALNPNDSFSAYNLVSIYADKALEDANYYDIALNWLETALENGFNNYPLVIKYDPVINILKEGNKKKEIDDLLEKYGLKN